MLGHVADQADDVLGHQATDRTAGVDTDHHPTGRIEDEPGRLQGPTLGIDEGTGRVGDRVGVGAVPYRERQPVLGDQLGGSGLVVDRYPRARGAEPLANDRAVDGCRFDGESAEWLRTLGATGSRREQALARLHELLLRVARAELRRRAARLRIAGPELDDLAHQAAADALLAITGKLGQFRGESRFTTWAYKFVIFEVSAKIGRHFWQRPTVPMEAEDWDKLPDRFGMGPPGVSYAPP